VIEVDPEGRSFERFTMDDLRHLLDIAKRDMQDFFERPDWGQLYADRVLCVTLCQGAALHYVSGTTGINDIDLYTFFRAHPQRPWYSNRLSIYYPGYDKFGRLEDKPDWVGRRIAAI
jgi:hypothetical protein